MADPDAGTTVTRTVSDELRAVACLTDEEIGRLAELARTGLLDLSVFEHNRFPLADVNNAISGLQSRNGGFSNYVIVP